MITTLVLIGLGLIAASIGLTIAHDWISEHGAGRMIGRFIAGYPIDGHHRTDASYWRKGTRVLAKSGRASRWAHLPHYRRAIVRLGSLAVLLAIGYGLIADPWLTLLTLGLLGLAAICVSAWGLFRFRQHRLHHRAFVRPLHSALAPVAGVSPATRPRDWITVPRSFRTDDEVSVTVRLPDDFRPDSGTKRALIETVTARLGLETAQADWRLAGRSPMVIITTSSPPPKRVSWDDIRPLVEQSSDTKLVLGLGRKQTPVFMDLDADSPHSLVSAGTGAGKSALVRAKLAQGLNRGNVALILDVKRTSHRWTKDLPSVYYCRSIEEIHEALVALAPELDRRNKLVDALSDENGDLPPEVNIGPRIWVVCEEMNATAARLAAYWRTIKEKEDPPASPAIEALGECLFMGRSVKVNVIGIAQLMTARTLGGPEARENFAYRCLSRYSVNAWKMLCPEVWPMPAKSRHVGRWQVVTGGEAREMQAAFITAKEARSWALAGIVTDFPAALMGEPERAVSAVAIATTGLGYLADSGCGATGVAAPADAVGLAAACAAGILTASLPAVRSARARDPQFPQPVDRKGAELLYSGAALKAWERNREIVLPQTALTTSEP